jgi:hypothetical protein
VSHYAAEMMNKLALAAFSLLRWEVRKCWKAEFEHKSQFF